MPATRKSALIVAILIVIVLVAVFSITIYKIGVQKGSNEPSVSTSVAKDTNGSSADNKDNQLEMTVQDIIADSAHDIANGKFYPNNPVSVEDAVNTPLSDADKMQIEEKHKQIAALWEQAGKDSEEYVMIQRGGKAFDGYDNDPKYLELYTAVTKDINSKFMEKHMFEALNLHYAEPDDQSWYSAPLNLHSRYTFGVFKFRGPIHMFTFNEYWFMDHTVKNKLKYEVYPPKTKDSVDKFNQFSYPHFGNPNDPDNEKGKKAGMNGVVRNIHGLGFSQYAVTVQIADHSTFQYNTDTQKAELINADSNGQKYDYLVVTCWAKLGNTWYAFHPHYPAF